MHVLSVLTLKVMDSTSVIIISDDEEKELSGDVSSEVDYEAEKELSGDIASESENESTVAISDIDSINTNPEIKNEENCLVSSNLVFNAQNYVATYAVCVNMNKNWFQCGFIIMPNQILFVENCKRRNKSVRRKCCYSHIS